MGSECDSHDAPLELSPPQALALLREGHTMLDLADGLQLRRSRLMQVNRIELTGFGSTAVDRLKAMGLFSEIISWKLRLFVPDDTVAGSAGDRAAVRTASLDAHRRPEGCLTWAGFPPARRNCRNGLRKCVQAVCRHYLPAGRREGRYWMVGDVAGTPGRSLYVRLFETERGAIGNWVDAATGEHGDLVDLIRLNQRHGRLAETIDEAERFLSLPPSGSDVEQQPHFAKPARAGSPTAAKRLFAASKPLTGSPAASYLSASSRGITRAVRPASPALPSALLLSAQ
jgi:hypothetical protein